MVRNRPFVSLQALVALALAAGCASTPTTGTGAPGVDADTEADLIVRILRIGQQRRSPPGPLLARHVKSEDPSVRAAAATALGLTGDAALGEMLLSIKRDELDVGREVVTALGRLGYAEGLPVVIDALALTELREAAGIALARYGRHEVAMGDGGRDAIAKWTGGNVSN